MRKGRYCYCSSRGPLGFVEAFSRSCRSSVGGDLAFDSDLSTLRREPLSEFSSIIGILEGTVNSPLVSTLYEKPFMGNCATSEIRQATPLRAATCARRSNISFDGAEAWATRAAAKAEAGLRRTWGSNCTRRPSGKEPWRGASKSTLCLISRGNRRIR